MILYKLISELSIRELKTVFVRTGRRGVFEESSAIIQLTIFLVRIAQDPFTYRFPISVPEDVKSDATLVKAEVSNIHVEDVKYVPEFECSDHSREIADGVSANVEETEKRDIESMVTEENLSDVQNKSGYEEVSSSSPTELADGLSTDFEIMLSSQSLAVASSVFLSSSSETKSSSSTPFEMFSKVSSKPLLARHSGISSTSSVWKEVSHRSNKCSCIFGKGIEDQCNVKPFYSEHWPPDFWVKF